MLDAGTQNSWKREREGFMFNLKSFQFMSSLCTTIVYTRPNQKFPFVRCTNVYLGTHI